MRPTHIVPGLLLLLMLTPASVNAQSTRATTPSSQAGVSLPSDYAIGVDDLLSVIFWREQDKGLTTDVVVRPDGKISVPMLNDIPAVGLTPEALATAVQQAASKYIRDAAATVIVREIRSRRVFVIGEVGRPGAIPLRDQMTVLQALAEAGGLLEHADKGDVLITRERNGQEQRFKFNYKDALKGKKPEQNIKLAPGDTILVH